MNGEESKHAVITKTTVARERNPGIAWDSECLSKPTPMTDADSGRRASNTRKTSKPHWPRLLIPQQCLPILCVEAKPCSFIVFGEGIHVLNAVDEELA